MTGKTALLKEEFEVFATALLEMLLRSGVIDANMLTQAKILARQIIDRKDGSLATMFHEHAPLGKRGRL